jgi:hypothetical protein
MINLSPFNNIFDDPFWRNFWNTHYRINLFAIPFLIVFMWYHSGYFAYQLLASYVFCYTFVNYSIYCEEKNR